MKKYVLRCMSIVIFSSLVTVAYAEESEASIIERAKVELASFFPDTDESNAYMGLGLSFMGLTDTVTLEKFDTTAVTFLGGYQMGEYVAIEAQYTKGVFAVSYESGSTSSKDNGAYPTDFTNMGIYAKLIFPFTNARVYGKIGYGQVSLTNIPDGDVDRAESGMQWGGGLDYTIGDTFTIFAEYMILYNDKGFDYLNLNNDQKVDLITVGLTYTF